MLKDLHEDQKRNLAVLGMYIKGVAHNINTPLSAIMGRAEMLQMRLNKIKGKIGMGVNEDELGKCERDVALLIENSNRITDIVKNIMQKSINAEFFDVQHINVSTILKDELEFLNGNMDFKHNIEKSFDIDEKIPSLNGKYVHFSNSFVEIIENSLQAMKNTEKKKLSISLATKDNAIEVAFHDTGCGIKADQVQNMLQVLNRSHSGAPDTIDCEKGVHRIAQALCPYNPEFSITSAPGDTTFSIRFPL